MMASTTPLAELTAETIKLLCREIGIVNTARFLNQFTVGSGNYTESRTQILGEQTVDEIVAEIMQKRATAKMRRRQQAS